MKRLITLIGVALIVGLSLEGSAQARIGHCANAYYRYKERGTSQYIEASHIRVQYQGCSRARRLARDYAHAYRVNYGTPRYL